MREERLLERIRSWEKEPVQRGKEDPRKVVDSVMAHLQRILNTRQGNVPIADDYGVPDFTDFMDNFPDSLRDMEKAIKNAVQKYEPRLKGVRISFVPYEDEMLTLKFQIMAKLSLDAKNQVYFETTIDSDGKVSIRS